jgi:hypothetical protein
MSRELENHESGFANLQSPSALSGCTRDREERIFSGRPTLILRRLTHHARGTDSLHADAISFNGWQRVSKFEARPGGRLSYIGFPSTS